jgi:hypothetical protein
MPFLARRSAPHASPLSASPTTEPHTVCLLRQRGPYVKPLSPIRRRVLLTSSPGVPSTPCLTSHSPAGPAASSCHIYRMLLLALARPLLRRHHATPLATAAARSEPLSRKDAKDKITARTQPLRAATHSPIALTAMPTHPLATIAVSRRAMHQSFQMGRVPTAPSRVPIKRLDLLSEPPPIDRPYLCR